MAAHREDVLDEARQSGQREEGLPRGPVVHRECPVGAATPHLRQQLQAPHDVNNNKHNINNG